MRVRSMGVLALVVMSGVVMVGRAEAKGEAGLPKVKIVLAGDSTVAVQHGWGPGFAKDLKPEATCVDLARNGRSSKSYRDEGWWKKCLAEKPDYIFLQFGHNDQPGKGPKRETDPETTYKANMARYVEDCEKNGIKPVLVTSLSRRTWGKDGKIHSTLVPYVKAVKEVGEEKHVPVIDLHALSIALYEKMGPMGVEELEPAKKSKGKKDKDGEVMASETLDTTHLNEHGSEVIGKMVGDAVKKEVPGLAPYIK